VKGAITPAPPVADVALPWDEELADPVAALAGARERWGDTFVVEGPRHPTLFLLSPEGVRSFYALPEAEASKGVADWMMLTRKLPDELFADRRTNIADLFGQEDVAAYLAQLDAAVTVAFEELGDEGEVDVFAFTRRLGHRMGLACWAGEVPSVGDRFDRLVDAFDELDGSAAFVHPEAMAAVAAGGKQAERAAMAELEELLAASIAARDERPPQDDLFARIVARWDGVPEPERSTGIARDVILVHIGSMSNLFAATGWTIAQLATHPDVLARVRDGDLALLERCALESTRLGQRSIMLRAVLAPTTVADEHHTYEVPAGAQVATLLPLTNTSAAPGLDAYDPERWARRRLRDETDLPARELVTTFGHGSHTCPAQPFSLAAMCASAGRFFSTYEVEARFADVEPLPVQIGGVARAARPCVVAYRRSARPS
jgi:cytochrome P450